jgi:NAD(P)-dependent dehydrogenase (short-subunit alcohol dehydrogenase family)
MAEAAKSLEGKHALVTGSTSGIGLETAAMLAESGVSRLVINGRTAQRGEAARAAILERAPGVEVTFIQADVSVGDGARALIEAAGAHLGGTIDVLVTCAGGDHAPTLFHETSVEEIEAVIRHWLLSTLHCCRLALPHIADGGAIVNLASDAAKVPTPGEAVIGAAMAGIAMFSRTLAMEAKRRRVRVNVVTPSLVQNTLTYDRITAGGFSARLFEKAAAAARLGVPEPRDVAALIVFLATPQAAKLTGQVVSVNGGISAG